MIVVTAKETRLLLRSYSAYVFLMLALFLVGGVFTIFWMSNVNRDGVMIRDRAELGRSFFSLVAAFQLAAMGLISPLMAATAVTTERENNTLDLLLSTGLPRIRLLLGKWLATIAYQLVLLVCLLPILALVFQLGGVGLDEYLFAAASIALTVMTYGMLGLAISCHCRRSIAALLATLIVVLLLAGGLPLGLVILDEFTNISVGYQAYPSGMPLEPLAFLFWCVSPVTMWIAHATPQGLSNSSFFGSIFSPVFVCHLCFQAALFLFSLLLAWHGFARREPGRARIAKRIIDDPAELARRRHRWPYYLVDPLRRAQVIGDDQNPVTIKEQRVGALARPHVMIRIGYLCLPFSVFLMATFFDGSVRELLQGGGTFALTLIMLIVPIFASTAISREHEEKTIDLLRTTPLPAAQIVRAKFLITLRLAAVITLGLLTLPLLTRFLAIFFSFNSLNYSRTLLDRILLDFLVPALYLIALIFAFSALYIAVGLFFSSGQRRNVSAMILTYLSLALLTYLPPLLDVLSMLRHSNFVFSLLSPLLDGLLEYIAPLFSHTYFFFWDSWGGATHVYVTWKSPVHDQGAGASALLLAPLHLALVLALAWLLLRRAARRLEKERP